MCALFSPEILPAGLKVKGLKVGSEDSDESRFNVSLTVMGEVHKSQFLNRKRELKRNQTEVFLLGQTGSHPAM